MILSKNNFFHLLKLAIPLSLTGIVSSAVFFFETLFLSQLGTDVLAAGALVSWLSGTVIVIIFGILSSINILVAHQHGANNKPGIALIFRDGLCLALILTLPTFVLLWNISPVFLILGQNKTIVILAKSYLHAWVWGIFPQFIMIAILEVIMGLGKMRPIVVFTTLQVILSVFFSYVFIFGKLGIPALGISGAGFGMSIGHWITATGLCVFVFTQNEYKYYFNRLTKLTKPFHLLELLRVGTPMGFMFCIEVGFFFALTLLMGTLGPSALAANQIVMQYNGPLISIIFSIAQAVTIQMGHQLGAKNVAAAKNTGYVGACISGLLMIIAAILFWFIPTRLISLDFNIHESKNSAIIQLATQFLSVCAIFQFFEAVRISFFGALRALKDTHFTLIISIISFWAIALPIGYLLAIYCTLGGGGLWYGMVLGAVTSVVLLAWRYKIKIDHYDTTLLL